MYKVYTFTDFVLQLNQEKLYLVYLLPAAWSFM